MKATILMLFAAIIVFRLIALILGCFYGPYIYMVLPLGGLYLTLDCITAYAIHSTETEDDLSTNERNFGIAWIVCNILAIIGLLVAVGLFLDLGFWAMTHAPIHLAEFVLICCLIVLIAMAILMLVMNFNRKRKPSNTYSGLNTSFNA